MSTPSPQQAYTTAAIARGHAVRVDSLAGTIKQRATASRQAGLDSLTLRLTTSDARLIGDALQEWADARAAAAVKARRTGSTA